MDEMDLALLRLLTQDARMSAAELGRRVGASRATVQNRIDRLKSSGVISRFTLELGDNASETGIDAFVLIKLTPADSRPVIANIYKLSQVQALHSLNGKYDLIAELRASSLQQLDEVLTAIRMLPRVSDTVCNIRMSRFK